MADVTPETPPRTTTLVATPGAANADTYLSLEAADTLADKFGLAKFKALADAKKEVALRSAAVDMAYHRYHHDHRCRERADHPALPFPRYRDHGVIPAAVYLCQLYQADFLATCGETDRQLWMKRDVKNTTTAPSGAESPLCPKAFNVISKFISRVGAYAEH